MQLVLRVGGIYMADDGLIGAVTSHGLNMQFAVQGNLEGENGSYGQSGKDKSDPHLFR